MTTGPLSGIRVIDVSRVLAGPYCAQLLADMGADVIKIEPPTGDENRAWAPFNAAGDSCNFMSVNRGKKSLTLNLKNAEAQALLKKLIGDADIAIHSFLPETARRLGLDFDELQRLNPKLICCTISGFGGRGPFRERPGYDLMMQSFAGIMSITGERDGGPVRCGASFVDMATGMLAYGGITTALIARAHGKGALKVEASLLETAVAFLGYHAVGWMEAGVMPERDGSGVWHLVPYQAFRCADGYVVTGATNDAAWARFCRALECEELKGDERYRRAEDRVHNRATLIPALERIFTTRSVAEWVRRLEEAEVAVSPLHTVDQVVEHPQVIANDMIVPASGGTVLKGKLLGLPFKLPGTVGMPTGAPPRLGEHTDEILRQRLHLSPTEIARLREAKVI